MQKIEGIEEILVHGDYVKIVRNEEEDENLILDSSEKREAFEEFIRIFRIEVKRIWWKRKTYVRIYGK